MDVWLPKVGDKLILRREPESVVDDNLRFQCLFQQRWKILVRQKGRGSTCAKVNGALGLKIFKAIDKLWESCCHWKKS